MASALEMRTGVQRWLESIARAYGQVFFVDSPWVGLAFLLATATAPQVFAFGLLAVAVATSVARLMNLDGELRASGYFGYNAFLAGAGIGYLYQGSWLTVVLVVLGATATVVLAGAARAWLTRSLMLPILSWPFLAVLWLVARGAPELGLAAAPPGNPEVWPAPSLSAFLADYARCLGSVLFVPNVRAGVLMAVALLLHSRLASLLSFGAFALVWTIGGLLPVQLPNSILATAAANAMLLSIAVGGLWFVPSRWSTLWSGAAVLVCMLVTVGVWKPLAALGLAPLFLPFNLLSLAVLLAARERGADLRPKSVDFAPGSPEANLRFHLNQRVRFPLEKGIRFHLPFRGRWTCTQSVDGEHTHQGPWRHAFDFQVVGQEGELSSGDPGELGNYHGYRLPVLATAPGLVVKIENDVPDNPIGAMNVAQNWGNFVVLQHAPGLFSLVAHLSPRTIRVKEGQQVVAGETLGLCGNSGRSPTPHIHFHLQKTPFPGAETLAMSFSDVVLSLAIGERLEVSHQPKTRDVCRNLEPGSEMVAAFRPGVVWEMLWNERVETVRADLDLLGQVRLQSSEGATATCSRTAALWIVHDVVGTPRSTLSLLRAALPRLPLEENPSLVWKDYAPALGLGGLSRLGEIASYLLPRAGLAMSYGMRREGTELVVEGSSFRTDKRGNALLRTRIVLEPSGVPVSILVRYRNREARAERAPNRAPQARTADRAREELAKPGRQEMPRPDAPVADPIDDIVSRIAKEL